MKKYEIFTFYNIYICIGAGDWGEWSEATCQKGVKLRGRGCYSPSQLYQGRPCQGSNVDEMFSDDDCTKKTPGNKVIGEIDIFFPSFMDFLAACYMKSGNMPYDKKMTRRLKLSRCFYCGFNGIIASKKQYRF